MLAVDDNTDALELVSLSLAPAGARMRPVLSGLEALQEWQRDPADVLVCDLAMPSIDGFDLLRRIREFDRVSGRVDAFGVLERACHSGLSRAERGSGIPAAPHQTLSTIGFGARGCRGTDGHIFMTLTRRQSHGYGRAAVGNHRLDARHPVVRSRPGADDTGAQTSHARRAHPYRDQHGVARAGAAVGSAGRRVRGHTR